MTLGDLGSMGHSIEVGGFQVGSPGPGPEQGQQAVREGRRQGRAPPWWACGRRADGGRSLGAPGVCGARLRRNVPEERGQGQCLRAWDSAELGALRWEPPQGKASSDCPRPGVRRIRGKRRCCRRCTPWVRAAPGEARAGWERGWGFAGQHLTPTARGLSCAPHARGCEPPEGALRSGDMCPSGLRRASSTAAQDSPSDKKVSKRPWGRSAQPGASVLRGAGGGVTTPALAGLLSSCELSGPLGAVPLPLFGTRRSP